MTRLISLIAAVVLLAVGGYLVLTPSAPGTTEISSLVGAANAQSADDIDTSSIVEMSIGAVDAPVTLIEYASFTCPHCAAFNAGPYQKIKENYIDTGKVRLIYREVYFDKFGLWASMMARCGGPEKFFGISDLIYSGQSTWARADGETAIVDGLLKIGRLAGIEPDKLDACMKDADMAQTLIAWFQKNAAADEVTATPSFILNGKKVSNQSYEDFAKLIDAELAN